MNQKIGPYSIIKILGSGGMGKVFLAEDTQLQRKVAIKTLHHSFDGDPKREQRFLNEARTMAKLNHPNIATLYDLKKIDNGYAMIMEYIEGETLAEWSKREENSSYHKYIPVIESCLTALAYAHKRDIVHRDIKPANIMIDKEGMVKIMDFGIATMKGMNRMTQVGNIVGTLEYISPEQLKGAEADNRSDIYSLGISVCECLMGQHPFHGSTEFQLIHKHQKERLPNLPNVSDTFQKFINKLTHKNPAKRFQTADAAVAALSSMSITSPISKKKIKEASRSNSIAKRKLSRYAPPVILLLGIAAIVFATVLAGPGKKTKKSYSQENKIESKEESKGSFKEPVLMSADREKPIDIGPMLNEFNRLLAERKFFGKGQSAHSTINRIKATSNGTYNTENLHTKLQTKVEETLNEYCKSRKQKDFKELVSNAKTYYPEISSKFNYDRDCVSKKTSSDKIRKTTEKRAKPPVSETNTEDKQTPREYMDQTEEENNEQPGEREEKDDEVINEQEPVKEEKKQSLRTVYIPKDTEVIGELIDPISSASLSDGQIIHMRLGRNINLNNAIISKEDGFVLARVNYAVAASTGKKSKLEIELFELRVGNNHIPLKDARISQNGSRKEDIVLQRGTLLRSFTANDKKIKF